jgi:alanine-synthesizing transaminase
MIADTYLSAGTPVQCALPSLLELRRPVQRQILDRLRGNLAVLKASSLRMLDIEAGWYAILPQPEGSELRLLREHDVLVQPGYFYDFENPGYIVLSLLTAPEIFREGIRRLQLE